MTSQFPDLSREALVYLRFLVGGCMKSWMTENGASEDEAIDSALDLISKRLIRLCTDGEAFWLEPTEEAYEYLGLPAEGAERGRR